MGALSIGVLGCLVLGLTGRAASAGMPPIADTLSRVIASSYQVSLSGSLTADSVLQISVTAPTPVSTADGAPFALIVKINGWTRVLTGVAWNSETQSWGTSWQIPPGMQGAHVTVTAVFPHGAISCQSFVVQ